ncbi:MAG: hypothetical protein ACOC0X_03970 [Halobacteriota archaeon]
MVDRRTLLVGLGAAAVGSTAGCLDAISGEEEPDYAVRVFNYHDEATTFRVRVGAQAETIDLEAETAGDNVALEVDPDIIKVAVIDDGVATEWEFPWPTDPHDLEAASRATINYDPYFEQPFHVRPD